MKKELQYLIFANILLISSIVYYTFDLITLIIDDTGKEALTYDELNPKNLSYNINNSTSTTKSLLIPKIIHQTYKTTDIPEHWKEGQQRCIDLHPDYKYLLWTDEMALNFIKEEYPWFLDTFKSYKYPIQRADAMRYFVLLSYGGVYIDLDDGCQRRLDPLLTVPAFLRKTSPLGVSNDVMGFVPRHPFLLKVIKSLKHYNKNWYNPYMTIMSSTGPLFISIIWKQYKRWNHFKNLNPEEITIRVIQPDDYKLHPKSFFSISKGSSWHMDDADFVKSFLTHILSCVVAGFVLGFFILYGEFTFYCWLCSKNKNFNFNLKYTKTILLKIVSWFKFLLPNSQQRNFQSRNYTNLNNNGINSNNNNISPRKQKKLARRDSNIVTMMNFDIDLEKNISKL
ncbi:zinc-finger protein [Maudiozyma exigua]|uniref:inositol phosphorylceramide mannosyltransferase n=1 Tax=Maudiozyma exigua TaxID=34358 RepID=A0A9P6W824_MAUEX|nr:zinc-finger protein [Kazachstania exigua]